MWFVLGQRPSKKKKTKKKESQTGTVSLPVDDELKLESMPRQVGRGSLVFDLATKLALSLVFTVFKRCISTESLLNAEAFN